MRSLRKKTNIGNRFISFVVILLASGGCVDLAENQDAKNDPTINPVENSESTSAEPAPSVSPPANQEESTTDISVNPTDYYGVYEGTNPCKDCEGVFTKIEVNSNETFKISTRRLPDGKAFEDNGTLNVIENGSAIHLRGKNTNMKLQIGNNQLSQINDNGAFLEADNGQYIKFYKK